ncbi:MAG: hypothetical protein ACTSUS_08700 [Candidatus Freyarchaeota archaeon]
MNKQRKEGILHITIEKTKEADSTEELNEMCKFFENLADKFTQLALSEFDTEKAAKIFNYARASKFIAEFLNLIEELDKL